MGNEINNCCGTTCDKRRVIAEIETLKRKNAEMYAMLDKISGELLEAGGVWNFALAKDIESLLAKVKG